MLNNKTEIIVETGFSNVWFFVQPILPQKTGIKLVTLVCDQPFCHLNKIKIKRFSMKHFLFKKEAWLQY